MPWSGLFSSQRCIFSLVLQKSFQDALPLSRIDTSCLLLQLGTSRRRKLLQTASIGSTPTSSEPGDGRLWPHCCLTTAVASLLPHHKCALPSMQ